MGKGTANYTPEPSHLKPLHEFFCEVRLRSWSVSGLPTIAIKMTALGSPPVTPNSPSTESHPLASRRSRASSAQARHQSAGRRANASVAAPAPNKPTTASVPQTPAPVARKGLIAIAERFVNQSQLIGRNVPFRGLRNEPLQRPKRILPIAVDRLRVPKKAELHTHAREFRSFSDGHCYCELTRSISTPCDGTSALYLPSVNCTSWCVQRSRALFTAPGKNRSLAFTVA